MADAFFTASHSERLSLLENVQNEVILDVEKFIREREALCGEHSFHLADFLKSLGILFLKQGHVVKAEMTFVRMDLLRDQRSPTPGRILLYDGSPPQKLMSDLKYLIQAQLAVQHYEDARHTCQRLRGLFATHAAEDDRHLEKELRIWEKQARRADSAKKEQGSSVSKLAELATEANKAGTEGAGVDVQDTSRPSSRQANVQQGLRRPMWQQVCAACGQGGTLLVCTACRAIKYCSPNCQRQDWKSHKTACRATASSANASSATKDAEALLRARFLATPGVLTCITVFAWAPSGVAVAAHVDLNAVLRGVRRCVRTGQDLDRTLHPLTSELRQCFGGVDAATVRIALVGGHRVSDHEPSLKLTLSKIPFVVCEGGVRRCRARSCCLRHYPSQCI